MKPELAQKIRQVLAVGSFVAADLLIPGCASPVKIEQTPSPKPVLALPIEPNDPRLRSTPFEISRPTAEGKVELVLPKGELYPENGIYSLTFRPLSLINSATELSVFPISNTNLIYLIRERSGSRMSFNVLLKNLPNQQEVLEDLYKIDTLHTPKYKRDLLNRIRFNYDSKDEWSFVTPFFDHGKQNEVAVAWENFRFTKANLNGVTFSKR